MLCDIMRERLQRGVHARCSGKAALSCLPPIAVILVLLWLGNCLENLTYRTDSAVLTMRHLVFDVTARTSIKHGLITWDNLDRVLASVSNNQREIIFTTFSGQYDDDDFERAYGMTAWNLNFVGHLRALNISNYLLIGADDLACTMTRQAGIDCWEDALGWHPWTEFFRGRQVGLKWFYLQQIVARGYHPIFLDNDVVVLQDPFAHWNRSIDIQGLYDMNNGSTPKEVSDYVSGSHVVCPLVTMGDYFTNWPCMSTGVMYVRATSASHAAITAMVDHLSREPAFWEQAMWQTEVLKFLSQEERRRQFVSSRRDLLQTRHPRKRPRRKYPRLRFQLLPLERFHNVNTLHARRRLNLTVDSVMVHCGYIHGTFDKIIQLHDLGLWQLPMYDAKPYIRP